MSGTNSSVAYSGGPPGQYPLTNIFDFVFGNPFQKENEHVPASQKIPFIDDRQPIFVDNKSGEKMPPVHTNELLPHLDRISPSKLNANAAH